MTKLLPSERKNLSWSEIQAYYSHYWVQTWNLDWPQNAPSPISGIVVAYSTSKDDLIDNCKLHNRYRTVVLRVAEPKDQTEVFFSANLHQWQNPELFQQLRPNAKKCPIIKKD